MKKRLFPFLFIASCGIAQALPFGNPSEAHLYRDGIFWDGWCGEFANPYLSVCDRWSVRFGFYGDYVFERYLEVDESGSDIENSELFTNAGYFAFNMWNRIEVFGTLGASTFYLRTPGSSFGSDENTFFEIDTSTGFSWSVGGRWALYEWCNFGIGVEAQWFGAAPAIDYVRNESAAPVYLDGVELRYREWQVGVGASYRIALWGSQTAAIPYVGLKWSCCTAKMDHIQLQVDSSPDLFVTLTDLESRKLWGFALGCTLLGCEKASLTFEGRFADELAFYLNGQVRF